MIGLKRRCETGGVWALCVLVFGLVACERPDPQMEIDAAAASLAAGRYEDAALRLNYVIRLEPDNARARELRGDISLLLGDYANAIADFVRARDLSDAPESIALRLVEAHLAQGQTDEALELLGTLSPTSDDEPFYWTLRAEALLAVDRMAEAGRSIERARRSGAGGARAMTAAAQIAFAGGDRAAAFDLIEKALAISANDPRVRIAHAELLARSDRLTEAAQELKHAADYYREASISPRETLSLLALLQVHIARNDLVEAEAIAARLARHAPNVHLTSYFQGLVEFRRGNFDEAATLIQPLVSASPESIQYRSLLGAIQLARGNLGQAEQQFLRVLANSPNDPAAAKLLAETRLRQKRPAAALDALLTVQDTAAEDPQIGFLSGLATLLSGNVDQGLIYLEQASALDPTNELLKMQLARAYLAAGRDAEASAVLTDSLGADERAIDARSLQLVAESRRGNHRAAADIAEGLLADNADDPRVLTVVAVHYQLNGETGRARKLFERAAELDTEDATARLFVSASLVQEGRHDEAEMLLRQTIAQQPENAHALAGLAQLLANRGAFEEAAGLFTRAAENTTSIVPRLALAQMQLRQGQVEEAKRQLDNAAAVAPGNPEVIALSGIVALAQGRDDDAERLLERAAHLLPDRLGVTLALARARLANGHVTGARDLLLNAIDIAPQSYPLRLALGEAELQSGNAARALSVATDLRVQFPSQSGGYVLEGKALIETRQYAAASKSLATAFERRPTWPVLALKIRALRLADRAPEALDAVKAWVADHPSHVPAELTRAVLLQAAGRFEDALGAYKSVLEIEPENLVALNNAAWVSHELKDPDALWFAERAHRVGPENAAVLDTLGWILLARGQDKLAIDHLTRAAELAPHVPEIRYHLAEALVAGRQAARARELLVALLAEAHDFEKRTDAERLLESI